jgi:hypothetical protein
VELHVVSEKEFYPVALSLRQSNDFVPRKRAR